VTFFEPLGPEAITQSADPNTITAGSVACANAGITTDNSWFRLFDLDRDFFQYCELCVNSVDYAIETAVDGGVPQSLTVNTACLDDGMPYLSMFLDPVGSVTNAQPDAELEFFNSLAGGCCDGSTQSLSVEFASEDCTEIGCSWLYVGANDLGQTAPSYFSAPDCGITEPTELSDVGFPGVHLIMVVHASGVSDCIGNTDTVPSGNGRTALFLVMLLLGSSAYYMRRRHGASELTP